MPQATFMIVTTLMACSPFVFTSLLQFVAFYGILLMPVGAIVLVEHWIFPRIGFQQFWAEGFIELPPPERDYVLFEAFRRDPERHPLKTPSGRIEIVSDTIERFGYDVKLSTPAEFQTFFAAELRKWPPILKATGIKPQ